MTTQPKAAWTMTEVFDQLEREMNRHTERIATAINAMDSDVLWTQAHGLFGFAGLITNWAQYAPVTRSLTPDELQAWHTVRELCVHVGKSLVRNINEMPASMVDTSKCFLYLARLRTGAAILLEVRRDWALRHRG